MRPEELDGVLKSVPVPRRTEEYWQGFPRQVLQRIDRLKQVDKMRLSQSWPQLGWVGFAVIVVGAAALWGTRPREGASGFSAAEL